MGVILVYIIKSGVALMLFYIFYRLLLPSHTFHRLNRVIIMSIVLLSAIVPLYTPALRIENEITSIVETYPLFQEGETVEFTSPAYQTYNYNHLPEKAGPKSVVDLIWFFMAILYLIGCLTTFLYTLFSFSCLYRLIKRSDSIQTTEGYRLLIIPEKIAPFSWMNYIVISCEDWQEYGENIYLHEQGHIQAGHSWDLLLIQLCVILHWFNPVAWLLKQELQNIHEFEADEYVLNKGVNPKQYQLLLIKKAVGSQRFTAMGNSFNHSKLKKRIRMMLKDKSNPWVCVKYLYIFPVSLLVVNVFARPEIAHEMKRISDITIDSILPEEKENILSEKDPPTDLFTLSDSRSSDFLEKPEEVTNVTNSNNQNAVIEREEASLTVIQDSLIIQPDEDERREVEIEAQQITFNSTNGVLVKQFEVDLPESFLAWKVRKNKHTDTGFQMKADPTKNPLVIVDGQEIPYSEMGRIDPQHIESLSVLKDSSASSIYGQKGLNGVIIITTKKASDRNLYRGDESELPEKKIRAIFNEVQENGLSKVFIDYKIKPEKENETAGKVWMGENMRLLINGKDFSNQQIETIQGQYIETLKIVSDETEQGSINTIYINTKE